ncbi:MAG: 30S ribosomal protein S9 [Candidatus Omnitrophota bacterium]
MQEQLTAKFSATGRRKEAVARVNLSSGEGKVTVNGRPFDAYFPKVQVQNFIMQPLAITQLQGKYNVSATVNGGGNSGQAGALRHGLARAIAALDVNLRPALVKAGLLTRDPRMRERKKYGQKGARQRFQWTKR